MSLGSLHVFTLQLSILQKNPIYIYNNHKFYHRSYTWHAKTKVKLTGQHKHIRFGLDIYCSCRAFLPATPLLFIEQLLEFLSIKLSTRNL